MTLLIRGKYRAIRLFLESEYIEEIIEWEYEYRGIRKLEDFFELEEY